jgi:hypothetical protein
MRQLTDDHSLVATMVREGLLTPAEAETHPRRNVLQRSMGVAEDVEIDVRGPFDLREGDTFILCSDGLHGVVKEAELREIAKLSIDEAADEFLRRALDRGAPDKVTVIVARVEEAIDGEAGAVFTEHVVGDETVVDRLEDTQRLEPVAPEQFDETLRDTDKYPVTAAEMMGFTDNAPAVPLDDTLEIAEPSASIEPATAEVPAPVRTETLEVPTATIETPPPDSKPTVRSVPTQAKKSFAWMWTLFFVIVVAAGAWYYMTQLAPDAKRPRPASTSRP